MKLEAVLLSMVSGKEVFEKMNDWGAKRIPFLFIIDFEKRKGYIQKLSDLGDDIQFSFHSKSEKFQREIKFKKYPISFETYKKQFDLVKENILKGNSYLTNLTCETAIETNLSFEEIYRFADAKFKLYVKNKFVCFSPESFVKIENNQIFSYPMKGTIDASIENAEEKILSDQKEMAEHYTIVDLIRNDLSQIAKEIQVTKFRFIEEINTNEKKLLQVSSEIKGKLPNDYYKSLGDIFDKLLPAGSICGAPKAKTIEIINDAECYDRKFYTGVFGVFDGVNLESAVMIRFIERTENGLVFKSGGGITHQSMAKVEYQEMIDKVYVPIN